MSSIDNYMKLENIFKTNLSLSHIYILDQDELEDEALEISYGDDKPEEKYEGTLGIEVTEIKT